METVHSDTACHGRSTGFFWNASISLVPFVSLHIRDLFRGGDGSAEVSLYGVVPSIELGRAGN